MVQLRSDGDAPGSGGSLRERRRSATRTEIAVAALDLFELQGYGSTTVEQIALRAGVSMRTFYRYCASKEEALAFDLAVGPMRLAELIEHRAEADLRTAVVAGFVETVGSGPFAAAEQRRAFVLIMNTDPLRGAWLAAGRHAQHDLVAVLASRMPDASAFVVRALSAAVIALLTAALEEWLQYPDADLRSLTETALSILGDRLPAS